MRLRRTVWVICERCGGCGGRFDATFIEGGCGACEGRGALVDPAKVASREENA